MKGRLTKAKGTDRLFATIKARREPCRARRSMSVTDQHALCRGSYRTKRTYRTTALLETPNLGAAVVLPRFIPDAACDAQRGMCKMRRCLQITVRGETRSPFPSRAEMLALAQAVSPGADVGSSSPAPMPMQMWEGPARRSRCE